MNELIKTTAAVIGGEEVNAVNARELWKFLKSKQDFSTWIKDRLEGFQNGQDFTVDKIVDGKNKGRFAPIEYTLTLDVAKHLAMMERNERGQQARQYFIEIEKQYRQVGSIAEAVAKTLMPVLEERARMRSELEFTRHFLPLGNPGELNKNGDAKTRFRRGYYTAGKGQSIMALVERMEQPGLFDEIELKQLGVPVGRKANPEIIKK